MTLKAHVPLQLYTIFSAVDPLPPRGGAIYSEVTGINISFCATMDFRFDIMQNAEDVFGRSNVRRNARSRAFK